MAAASLTLVRVAADRVAAASSGGRQQARGERWLVRWAHGPLRRQRPVDDVAADVVARARAGVEEHRMPIALYGEQVRVSEFADHGLRSLIGSAGVVGVVDHQDGVGGGAVPRAGVAVGRSGRAGRTRLVIPGPPAPDIARPRGTGLP